MYELAATGGEVDEDCQLLGGSSSCVLYWTRVTTGVVAIADVDRCFAIVTHLCCTFIAFKEYYKMMYMIAYNVILIF